MKAITLITLSILLISCSHQKTRTVKSTHTMKLKKSISVGFNDLNSLSLNLPKNADQASLKVIGVDENEVKTVLFEKEVLTSAEISLESTLDLESFTLLVATLNAKDSNGNKMSDVSVYRVHEQKEIDDAKAQIKSLRK